MQSLAPDDGRKDRPKHLECFTRINNLRNRCMFLVLIQEYKQTVKYNRFLIINIFLLPSVHNTTVISKHSDISGAHSGVAK